MKRRSARALPALALAAATLIGGCSSQGRLLAVEPTPAPPTPPPLPTPVAVADPLPIRFPEDEASHRRLTEWWYHTGHLETRDGRRFGFEFVIFRTEHGIYPVGWASHLALTDEGRDRFLYDQRNDVGGHVDRSRPGGALDLAITRGPMPTSAPSAGAAARAEAGADAWTMRRFDGRTELRAATDAFALDLVLDDGDRPPTLHDHDGWVDFGPAGGSYYYSRTRMATTGTLTLDGRRERVAGITWFDHQWGDFIVVADPGWDWFAINLDDGTDLMLFLIRGPDRAYALVFGTLTRPDGRAEHLSPDAFAVAVTDHWTSAGTGATYPSGWRIEVPGERLRIELTPTVRDQELDTRATSGTVYWEGSQRVRATRDGRPLGGEAYVELTGYGPGGGAAP